MRVKYKERIEIHKVDKKKGTEYYDVKKFKDEKVVKFYQEQLGERLNKGEDLREN